MKNSISFISKDSLPRAKTENSPEESSWTFYFEDFVRNYDEPTAYSCDYESPFISDAASSSAAAVAAKKDVSDNDLGVRPSLSRSYNRSLSFKKRKTGVIVDDSLEDTATSPVNSPKVSYFNQFELRLKDKEHTDTLVEKDGECGQADGRNDFGIDGRERDYSDLKKRGLCLVPVSTLAKYIR